MNAIAEQFGSVVHPAWAKAINNWLISRPDFLFTLNAKELALKWLPTNMVSMNIHIQFECQGYTWWIMLDSLRALDPRLVGEPFLNLPSDLRTLILKKAIAVLIPLLPSGWEANLDIKVVEWGKAELQKGQILPFSIINITDRAQSNGILSVNSPETLVWLNQNLPAGRPLISPGMLSDMLEYTSNLNIGMTELSLDQINNLESGDFVWIETARLSSGGIKAWFELHMHADQQAVAYHGYLKQSELIIKKTTPCSYKKFATDENKLPRNFTETIGVHIETGQLELSVTFDLGELTLPLADIERIGPNYIFELPQEAADSTVNMRVNGMLIAQGKLIVVGRRLGVRVTGVCQVDKQSNIK